MDTMLAALPRRFAQESCGKAAATELSSRMPSQQRAIDPTPISNWGHVREARLHASDFPDTDAEQPSEPCSMREHTGMQPPAMSEHRDETSRCSLPCMAEDRTQCEHVPSQRTSFMSSALWQRFSSVADPLAPEVDAQEPTPPSGNAAPGDMAIQNMSSHTHSIKALKSLTRMVMYVSTCAVRGNECLQLGTLVCPTLLMVLSAGAQPTQH